MSKRSITLTDSLYEYMNEVSLREPPLLLALREETAALTQRSMQISPEQGQFMALIVRLIGARRCLEVGVFTGYSSLATALALPDDGRIVACDVSEEWTSVARRYWKEAGVAHKIELRLAPAADTLDALLAQGKAGTFDFAFIDADKTNYLAYYERTLALLRTGGLVLDRQHAVGRQGGRSGGERCGHRGAAALQRSPASRRAGRPLAAAASGMG